MIIKQNDKEKVFRSDYNGIQLMKMLKPKTKYAVFDIELDSLFAEGSILKFSGKKYVVGENLHPVEILSTQFLGKPVKQLHLHISQITGLTDKELEDGFPQYKAKATIDEFFADVDYIVGYNITPDTDYLIYNNKGLASKEWLDILEMLRDFLPSSELSSYNPTDIFDLFSIDYNNLGKVESLNQLLIIIACKYEEDFTCRSESLINPKINELYYNFDIKKPKKLYINTDCGQFCFDLKKLVYSLRKTDKDITIDDIDMESMRINILNHFNAYDERKLCQILETKRKYAAKRHKNELKIVQLNCTTKKSN